MTELNISHFNGLVLTYIDLIVFIKTSVYIEKTTKRCRSASRAMSPVSFFSKELRFMLFKP